MKKTAIYFKTSITRLITHIHGVNILIVPALFALFFILSSLEEIIEDVLEGKAHGFDMHILKLMRNPNDMSDPRGPQWLEELMRDFSAMGGIGILSLFTITSFTFLFVTRKKTKVLFLLTAVATGTVLTNLLKAGFDRPRPDLIPHETYVYTASFPSGHSMMATIVYLTIGGIMAENEPRTRLKIFILCIAITISLLVGVSRAYLGAHRATDVLTGWLAGAAWALIFWILERFMIYRKRI